MAIQIVNDFNRDLNQHVCDFDFDLNHFSFEDFFG
jgi:hypothetical protein